MRSLLSWRPLVFAALGAATGLLDTWGLGWLGVEMTVRGEPTRWPAALLFGATYAVMGGMLGHLFDVRRALLAQADRLRAQQARLVEQQDRLVQAEKLAALGRVTAGVAHEVRNPLAVIRASAGLVGEALPETASSAQRAAGFIRDEVDRLDAFVEAVLRYARPAPAVPRSVATAGLLQRAGSLAAAHLGGRALRLDHDACPPALRVDDGLLLQALLGLLVNAAQATPETGEITLRAVADPAGGARIEVEDDGAGLPDGDPAQLFEPFFTTRAEGTGLGLAMAERVVAAHGGTLRAEPRQPHGARFVAWLPEAA